MYCLRPFVAGSRPGRTRADASTEKQESKNKRIKSGIKWQDEEKQGHMHPLLIKIDALFYVGCFSCHLHFLAYFWDPATLDCSPPDFPRESTGRELISGVQAPCLPLWTLFLLPGRFQRRKGVSRASVPGHGRVVVW